MVFGADWDDPDREMPAPEGYAYTLDELRKRAAARAIPGWNAAAAYYFGDVVRAPDGRICQAICAPETRIAPADGVDGWRRLTTPEDLP